VTARRPPRSGSRPDPVTVWHCSESESVGRAGSYRSVTEMKRILLFALLSSVGGVSLRGYVPLRNVQDLVSQGKALVQRLPPDCFVPHIRSYDDSDSDAITKESTCQERQKIKMILEELNLGVRSQDFYDVNDPHTEIIAYHDRNKTNDIVLSDHWAAAVEMIPNSNEALSATVMLLGHEIGHHIFFQYGLKGEKMVTPEKFSPSVPDTFPKPVVCPLLPSFCLTQNDFPYRDRLAGVNRGMYLRSGCLEDLCMFVLCLTSSVSRSHPFVQYTSQPVENSERAPAC